MQRTPVTIPSSTMKWEELYKNMVSDLVYHDTKLPVIVVDISTLYDSSLTFVARCLFWFQYLNSRFLCSCMFLMFFGCVASGYNVILYSMCDIDIDHWRFIVGVSYCLRQPLIYYAHIRYRQPSQPRRRWVSGGNTRIVTGDSNWVDRSDCTYHQHNKNLMLPNM